MTTIADIYIHVESPAVRGRPTHIAGIAAAAVVVFAAVFARSRRAAIGEPVALAPERVGAHRRWPGPREDRPHNPVAGQRRWGTLKTRWIQGRRMMAPLRKPQRGDAPRRASGALESAVLNVLWAAGMPLSAAEVRERLLSVSGAGDLAYTTVVTTLTRMFEKNTLARERDGRAFRYAPVADEAGLAARRLSAMLDGAADREAVLSRFVRELSEHDEDLLRAALDGRAEITSTNPE